MEERSVQYGTTTLWYQLVRTERRTLGFIIHPDTRLEMRVPFHAKPEVVDALVLRKAPWIVRQQDFFRSFLPTAPTKHYVSGESHHYMGRQYRLKVHATTEQEEVKLVAGRIHIHSRHPKDPEYVRGLLSGWYREHARIRFQHSVDKALPLFTKHGIAPPTIRIQHMRKRWGSCTPKGRILLNPELIKAPGMCIDYVVVHELCHLVYPDHGPAFRKLMDRIMPQWAKWKTRLEETHGA